MSDGVRLAFGSHVAHRATQSQALRGALWLGAGGALRLSLTRAVGRESTPEKGWSS